MSSTLIGDPKLFAVGITWFPCQPLGDMALSHTWCEFVLWCGGTALTRHAAQGNVYEGLFVPAAPIAAWIGRAWVPLVSEEKFLDCGRVTSFHALLAELNEVEWDEQFASIDRFFEGHALFRMRGGLLLPSVIFWRRGDVVDVSWRPSAEGSGERVAEFFGSGHFRVAASVFFDVLRRFVRAVNEHARRAPDSSFMRGEVEAALHAVGSMDDAKFLAERVGRKVTDFQKWLDERTHAQEPRDALVEAYGPEIREAAVPEEIDSPVARAARSASPAFSERDHGQLILLGQRLRASGIATALTRLRTKVLAEARLVTHLEDYELGYERANLVRRALKNRDDHIDVENALRRLGCRLEDVAFDDVNTDGVALWTVDGHALVATNVSSPRSQATWGRRAMLAHELHHLLFDASSAQFFGECTSDWSATPTEREANAFAAEFLLPAAHLKGLPETATLETWRETVRALLQKYETGWELTVRHLRNRRRLPRHFEAPLLNALLT